MKHFLLQFFTWWHGQTLGTRFLIWRRGTYVGKDAAGNRYYRSHDHARRWVIYAKECEASEIAPGWHGWMHHRTDTPPVDESGEDTYKARAWEQPHQANPTGTANAYHPPGSLAIGAPPSESDVHPDPNTKARPRNYDAWKP